MASALHFASQDKEKQRAGDCEPGEGVRHGYVYCRDSNPVNICSSSLYPSASVLISQLLNDKVSQMSM